MSAASRASGARRVSTPGAGISGFRNVVESTSSMPSDSSTLRDGADQRIRIFERQRKEKLREFPVRANRAEDLVVLHLPGHHGAGDAFLVQQFERAREFSQADPVQSRRDFLQLGRSLFANRDHRHVNPLAARGFEHQKWKLSVAGNESPANGGVRDR